MLDYYETIPVGRENAITREELANKWGVSQDKARHIIAELRAVDQGDDFIIFSSSDPQNPGYYKTADPAERRAFMAETKRRAINTFKPLKKAQRIENGNSNQYSLCNNLKIYRKDKGLSNEMLCEALTASGVPMSTPMLSRIENGHVLPSPRCAELMAEIIGCDVSDIFGFGYAAITGM